MKIRQMTILKFFGVLLTLSFMAPPAIAGTSEKPLTVENNSDSNNENNGATSGTGTESNNSNDSDDDSEPSGGDANAPVETGDTIADESEIPLYQFPVIDVGIEVDLERVLYPTSCNNVWGIFQPHLNTSDCGNYIPHPDFPQWIANDVSQDTQKDTYIATVYDPAPQDVEYLVLIVGGQQGMDIIASDSAAQTLAAPGFPGSLTGQRENYRKDWPENTPSQRVGLDSRSLAVKLMGQGWFPKDKTFMALVFDAAFYFDSFASEKEDIVGAYVDWLLSQVGDRTKVKRIYLAGASRGGCLTAQIGEALRDKDTGFDNAEILVSNSDGVCNHLQNEAGAYNNPVFNPIMEDNDGCNTATINCYFAYDAYLEDFFGNTEDFHLFQIHGGGNVSFGDNLALNPRAYTYESRKGAEDWYLQKWVPYGHKEMCRSYEDQAALDTIDSHLSWLKYYVEKKNTDGMEFQQGSGEIINQMQNHGNQGAKTQQMQNQNFDPNKQLQLNNGGTEMEKVEQGGNDVDPNNVKKENLQMNPDKLKVVH